MQAVILAGERGAPLYPLTARQPRALLPLAAKPLVQFQLELLKEHGIDEAVLCLSAMPEAFEARFGDGKDLDMTLRYHRERFPLGTAGAVRAVMNRLIGENVLILNGHILTDADLTHLMEFHKEREAAVTMLLATVPNPADFGVVVTDSEGRITSFAEKPAREEAASDTINAGVYVLRRDIIFRMPPETEFSFERQLFPQLLAEGVPMYGLVERDKYWRAISTLTDYQQGITDILERRVAAKIEGSEVREGVWVGDAATIHPTAELRGRIFINHHTEIARDAKVSGIVSIGSRCRIEEGAVVEDAILWRGTTVEAGATVRGCILGDNCIVRAGATVQPGSVVGADAVIASVVAKLPSRGDIQRAGIKFSTEGWIGTIADDVTVDNVRVVTQAVCDWVLSGKPGNGIVIGYDRRAQSEVFARAVAGVVAANGIRVLLSDQECPSPVVSFACRYYGAAAGIMITASHFGPELNGLKVKANYGGPTTADLLGQIEDSLRNLLRSGSSPKVASSISSPTDISKPYRAHLSRFANLKNLKKANLKVVVDSMYGAGSGYLSSLLTDAGVDVTEIRAERNPCFAGIYPEPVPQNMGALFEAVRERGADIGISLDGDGDQLGACDAAGNYVDGNRIAAVLLKYLYEERNWRGGVARDVATTRALDKLSAQYSLPLIETPIGFRYLGAAMLKDDILLAATESGGIGIRGHLPDRDGMMAALLLLEAMAVGGKRSLEQLIEAVFATVGRHEDARTEIHPPQERMHTIISALQSYRQTEFAGVDVVTIIRRDGTLLNLADGSWILLRPSGTEPIVRLYAEAESAARAEELIAAGVQLVNSV